MPFSNNSTQKHCINISPGTIEAYRESDSVRLIVSEAEYRLPLSTARNICDLLSITAYDESIVGLIAKRRILSNENERLKEKLHNIVHYHRRFGKRKVTHG